jgi:hypothetical protein
MPTPNEVAGGYTKDVTCRRCHGTRWVRVDVLEPYTCQRCRRVLAGRPAIDPLGTPKQQEQGRRLAQTRAQQRFQRGKSETEGPK